MLIVYAQSQRIHIAICLKGRGRDLKSRTKNNGRKRTLFFAQAENSGFELVAVPGIEPGFPD
jgi:hypothetical protein